MTFLVSRYLCAIFFYYKLWLLVQNYEILSEDLKLVSLPSRSFVADSKPAV